MYIVFSITPSLHHVATLLHRTHRTPRSPPFYSIFIPFHSRFTPFSTPFNYPFSTPLQPLFIYTLLFPQVLSIFVYLTDVEEDMAALDVWPKTHTHFHFLDGAEQVIS